MGSRWPNGGSRAFDRIQRPVARASGRRGCERGTPSGRPGRSPPSTRVARQPGDRCRSAIDRAIPLCQAHYLPGQQPSAVHRPVDSSEKGLRNLFDPTKIPCREAHACREPPVMRTTVRVSRLHHCEYDHASNGAPRLASGRKTWRHAMQGKTGDGSTSPRFPARIRLLISTDSCRK